MDLCVIAYFAFSQKLSRYMPTTLNSTVVWSYRFGLALILSNSWLLGLKLCSMHTVQKGSILLFMLVVIEGFNMHHFDNIIEKVKE